MSQNIHAAQIVVIVALAFITLSLFCAVAIGWRRPKPSDPFALPFGEMPIFTSEQLHRLKPRVDPDDPLKRAFAVRDRLKREAQPLLRIRQDVRPDLPSDRHDAGGGGFLSCPRPAAARDFLSLFGFRRHA